MNNKQFFVLASIYKYYSNKSKEGGGGFVIYTILSRSRPHKIRVGGPNPPPRIQIFLKSICSFG